MGNATNFWVAGGDQAPSLTPSDIARWETERGVRLPEILAKALLIQNGGAVHGAKVSIEPLDGFTTLADEFWDGVWEDRPPAIVDRRRQFYVGDSIGVGVVLDYTVGPEPRVLLLHHGLGRELRDEGIGSLEELLRVACLVSDDSRPERQPAPPPSSLWVTSVGPNFAKVFAVVREVMGIPASEAKALLRGPAFRVAVGWPSEMKSWRDKLQLAGASVEVR